MVTTSQGRFRTGRKGKPLSEHFWEKVQKSDGCWTWLGARDRRGYGSLTVAGQRRAKAHRVAWMLTNGPIPSGRWVLHRCDNPPCVNPAHLFLGDAGSNVRDMHAKGRARNGTESRATCKRGHPLSGSNVYIWRNHRHCIACNALRRWLRRHPDKTEAEWRSGGPATHCSRGHPFSPDNTYASRGKRRCMKCSNIRSWLKAHPDKTWDDYQPGREPLKTHCSRGHEFTPENTYWRRATRGNSAGRMCRACRALADKRHKAKASPPSGPPTR